MSCEWFIYIVTHWPPHRLKWDHSMPNPNAFSPRFLRCQNLFVALCSALDSPAGNIIIRVLSPVSLSLRHPGVSVKTLVAVWASTGIASSHSDQLLNITTFYLQGCNTGTPKKNVLGNSRSVFGFYSLISIIQTCDVELMVMASVELSIMRPITSSVARLLPRFIAVKPARRQHLPNNSGSGDAKPPKCWLAVSWW